jgi:hypothetical protein
MADEENKGYRVEDRRFSFREEEKAEKETTKEEKIKEEGQAAPAEDAAEAKPVEQAEAKPVEQAKPAEQAECRPGERPSRPECPLPPVTFATFIFSLNSSALIHLGELPDPASGQSGRDVGLAKQTIDLLGMLKEKTRGNLTPDEDQMLDAVLFDLRMRYLKLAG